MKPDRIAACSLRIRVAILQEEVIADDETAATLDAIANAETDDFGEIMNLAGVTPNSLKSFCEYLSGPDKEIVSSFLDDYRARVEALVDAAITDGRTYLNRAQQVEVFMNVPFLPKQEPIYHK